ncbi:MAG: HupE/UreJ family protein [Cytophagaceae bacterium]|nr:HupE/UreJ family protein [Cytophagaceae bacterium]
MYSFYDFFKLGLTNLAQLDVFGHILFIIALCGIYTVHTWKPVFGYVLTFILGYLITFLLNTFDYISLPDGVLTYTIPFTILITAITNFNHKKKPFINKYPSQTYRYYLGFAGGLIHGFSFPKIFKIYLLSPDDLVFQIVAFNLGVVTGLAIIVLLLLIVNFFITFVIRVNIREWNLLLSGACAGIALYIIANLMAN